MNNRWMVPMTKLENLVAYGSGARGFFAARGRGELTRAVAERITDVFAQETRGLRTPAGERSTIGSIVWIDADRSFDPSLIADGARARGLDVQRVLRLVRVVRPQSGATAECLADSVPPPALIRRSTNGVPTLMSLVPLVVLSDVLALEQLANHSDPTAYERWLERVSRFGRKSILLGLDHSSADESAAEDRRRILGRFARSVRTAPGVDGPELTTSAPLRLGRPWGWQPAAVW